MSVTVSFREFRFLKNVPSFTLFVESLVSLMVVYPQNTGEMARERSPPMAERLKQEEKLRCNFHKMTGEGREKLE